MFWPDMFNARYVMTRYFVFATKLSLLFSRYEFCIIILWSDFPGLGKSGQLWSTFISVDIFPDAPENSLFHFFNYRGFLQACSALYLVVLINLNFAEFVIFLLHPHALSIAICSWVKATSEIAVIMYMMVQCL